ncbi:hypothetical protein ACHQM5_006045 [Ranunculus cassubicifolius]
MTVKGGTNQACAACKYQRRKCSSDCPLAPYFPADQPKMFTNAHKLFGVSNILKVLKQLHPDQRKDAMRSIIYHANVRDKSPVYGVYGIVADLRYQFEQTSMELEAVNAQLALCRQQYNQQQSDNSPSSKLQLGQASSPNSALPLFQQCCPPQQNFNSNSTYGNTVFTSNQAMFSDYIESKDVNANPMWIQQQQYQNDNNYSSAPIQGGQFLGAQEITIKQLAVEEEDPQDYDEIPAFFDIIDDRQSYIDSKEAYESSSDSSLKDNTRSNMEQISDNELKSAAACFTLTSVN